MQLPPMQGGGMQGAYSYPQFTQLPPLLYAPNPQPGQPAQETVSVQPGQPFTYTTNPQMRQSAQETVSAPQPNSFMYNPAMHPNAYLHPAMGHMSLYPPMNYTPTYYYYSQHPTMQTQSMQSMAMPEAAVAYSAPMATTVGIPIVPESPLTDSVTRNVRIFAFLSFEASFGLQIPMTEPLETTPDERNSEQDDDFEDFISFLKAKLDKMSREERIAVVIRAFEKLGMEQCIEAITETFRDNAENQSQDDKNDPLRNT